MVKRFVYQAFAWILIILAGLSIVFGSITPLEKGRGYIRASRSINYMRSLGEFTDAFDAVFAVPSPIGDEEIGRFTGSSIYNLVSNENQEEESARALAEYAEGFMRPDNMRHLLLLGDMYAEMVWSFDKNPEYLEKAEEYLYAAHEMGEDVPRPLYSLLRLYKYAGDGDKVIEIANKILELWPDDHEVAGLLDQIFGQLQ